MNEMHQKQYEPQYRAYLLHEEEDITNYTGLYKQVLLLTPVHICTSHVLSTNKYIIFLHSLCTL